MDNQISLTEENFRQLFSAFGHYYPEGVIYQKKNDLPFGVGDFNWNNRERFIKFISGLTKVPISDENDLVHIKQAQIELARMEAEKRAGIEGKVEEATKKAGSSLPDKYLREQQEAERQRREKILQETQETGKTLVRTGVEKQKQIYERRIKAAREAQKRKESIYVGEKESSEIPKEVIEEIKKDPDAAIKARADDIRSRTNGEIDEGAIQLTATYIVADAITNSQLTKEAVAAQTLKGKPEFKDIGDAFADQSLVMHDLAKIVADRAYGKNNPFVRDLDKFNTSDNFQPGATPLPSGFYAERNEALLTKQNEALSNLKITKESFMISELDRQLALIKAGGIQGAEFNYTETLVQQYFQKFRPDPSINIAPVKSMVEAATGAAEPFKLVGGLASGAAKQAVKKGVAKAVISFLGKLGAPESGGLTIALAEGLNWIASKIDWKAVKKYSALIIGGISALLAAPFVGIGGALAIGVGATVVSFGMGAGLGAVTLGSIGYAVGGFIGAVSGAILGSVLVPVLMALLAFPLFVALILFIINSGAYVVPPSPLTVNVFGNGVNIECTDKKGPVGIAGPSSSSPIANRAWEISYDLYQGFWCFWNRSPKAPPQYFPNDTLKYPPGYPNLFDYQLFLKSPNISEGAGPNLFWCTWLPVKAYQENGNKIAAELYVPNMYNDFKSRGKIIEASKATPHNIPPGSVVFFQVTSGEFSNRLNHVGVVYSVDPGGMVVVESNNAIKSESINFRPGGGAGSLPGMLTKYFGLP